MSTKMYCITRTLMIVILLIPYTFSDRHEIFNRSNSIQKKRHHEMVDEDYPSAPPSLQSAPLSGFASSGTSSSGCSSCKMREELKLRNLKVIKENILKKLGLSQAPNITGRDLPSIPEYYLAKVEEAGMQSDEPYKTGFTVTEEEDDFHVKTQNVLTFAQPYPRMRHSWKGHEMLHFMFKDSISKFHVANATLYIYIKGTEKRPLNDVIIEVFKVRKISDHPDSPVLSRVYGRKVKQPYGRGDWIKIDFTVTVSEWFKNSRENLGFVVNATVNGKKVVVTDTHGDKGYGRKVTQPYGRGDWIKIDFTVTVSEWFKNSRENLGFVVNATVNGKKVGVTDTHGDKAPFVEIATREPKRRIRRNLGLDCDEQMNQPLCCRYSFIVDFEVIGFDFIIAPKRYDAHMCVGECPFVTLQKYAHTHLLKLAAPNSAAPCCAPRKMSPISMLYFDHDLNVVFGSLPGMVVDRCGCS